MKQLIKTVGMKFFLTALTFLSSGIFLFAQDDANSSTTVTTTHTETQTWYMQPWVWVVGAAVFILLLIALVRGNRRSDITVTKTTTERNEI